MPERICIAKIYAITDDDTGIYRIGEIDGGFDQGLLRQQIAAGGNQGLLWLLGTMVEAVIKETRTTNQEKQEPELSHAMKPNA